MVNFVYTGCSQVCPTTTRFLAKAVREARRALGAGPLPRRHHRLQPALRHAAGDARLRARSTASTDPNWEFLSPDAGAVDALTRDFGFTYEPHAGGFDHLTQVTILDAERAHLPRRCTATRFDVPMLVGPLQQLVAGAPRPRRPSRALLENVRLLCTVYDRSAGATASTTSLFIELAVGLA